ncbi:MAG: hypothetical protein KDB24_16570 [Microthrixaceae bacterium]|nr:hypothetical protein [Microthrixaceae bacterium]
MTSELAQSVEVGSAEERPFCFFITPLGPDLGPVRSRSDDILELIISPVMSAFNLDVVRADQIGQPGRITAQVIGAIVSAEVVVADLTGANANVYYELGVAHSLGRPVISMVDKVRSLAFDIAHDRAIVLGDDGQVSLAQGKKAEGELRTFVEAVVEGRYQPRSVVTEGAAVASVDELAGSDPVLAGISQVQSELGELQRKLSELEPSGLSTDSGDLERFRDLIATLFLRGIVDEATLRNELVDGRTSQSHDEWLEGLLA